MKYVFEGNEFKGYYAAEKKAKELGMLYGSMECDRPIAVVLNTQDAESPPKWRYMDMELRREMTGAITGEMRNSPVTLTIFDDVDINPFC